MAQSPLFRQVRQWVQDEIARRQRDVGVIGNSINAGSVVGNSGANARVGVRKNSTGDTYLRRRLNLIEGSNITVTLADDNTDEEVDVTLAVDDPLLQSVVRALDGNGLRLEDDAGNLGVFVEDGGNTGFGGVTNPAAPLHGTGTNNTAIVLLDNGRYYGVQDSGGTAKRLLGMAGNNDIYMGAVDDAGGRVIIREDGSDAIIIEDGNLGIGTSDIESWHSDFRAMQLGLRGALMWRVSASSGSALWVINNAYYDGAWKRRTANEANLMQLDTVGYRFFGAVSGAADSAISWSELLQLSNSNIIGTPSGAALGESWNAPSFNTGWTNGSAGYNAGYRKFGDMVMLRGTARRTSGSATTIFTLPAGYRPSSPVQGIAEFGGGIGVRLTIQTSGNVDIPSGYTNDDNVWLDGIMFSI